MENVSGYSETDLSARKNGTLNRKCQLCLTTSINNYEANVKTLLWVRWGHSWILHQHTKTADILDFLLPFLSANRRLSAIWKIASERSISPGIWLRLKLLGAALNCAGSFYWGAWSPGDCGDFFIFWFYFILWFPGCAVWSLWVHRAVPGYLCACRQRGVFGLNSLSLEGWTSHSAQSSAAGFL